MRHTLRQILFSIVFAIFFWSMISTCRAQVPNETCAAVTTSDPDGSTALPATLTPLPDKSYRVELHFLPTSSWTDLEKQYLCAAARHVGEVFSSKEFADAFTHLPDLIRNRYGFFHEHIDTIKSGALYTNITRQNVIVMDLGITNKHIQCAKTVVANEGPTTLDKDYVDGPKKLCGGPLLAALTNTLAHEYTHYNSPYIAYDNDVVDDPTYVSYGIGCLVQNLAFKNNTCPYDPRTTQPQSSGLTH